jgi:hypothetical protein
MRSAGLLAAYFATRVVIVVFASALFTKPLAAGLAALVVSYVEPIIASLPRWKSLAAYSLIDMANNSLGTGSEISGWVLAVALMAEVAVMALMTVWRMKSVEIAPGAGAQ